VFPPTIPASPAKVIKGDDWFRHFGRINHEFGAKAFCVIAATLPLL